MGGSVHVYGRGVGRCDSFVGGEGEGEGEGEWGVSLYRLRDMGWRDGLCGWRGTTNTLIPRHMAANAVTPCAGSVSSALPAWRILS